MAFRRTSRPKNRDYREFLDAVGDVVDVLPTDTQFTNLIAALDVYDLLTAEAVLLNADGSFDEARTARLRTLSGGRTAQEGLEKLRTATKALRDTPEL
jgi:hypothetical protein